MLLDLSDRTSFAEDFGYACAAAEVGPRSLGPITSFASSPQCPLCYLCKPNQRLDVVCPVQVRLLADAQLAMLNTFRCSGIVLQLLLVLDLLTWTSEHC